MEIEDSKALRVAYSSHIHLAGEILTDEAVGDDVKLQTIETIKKIFADSSTKSLRNVKLESLVNEVGLRLTSRTSFDRDIFYGYGIILCDFIGRYGHLDLSLFEQLESVLFKLNKLDEELTDKLVEHLWQRFVNNSIFNEGFLKNIMHLLGKIVERLALYWINGAMSAPSFDYYLKISSECPEFFQATSSVFYETLLKTEGSTFVLEKITKFVKLVISCCEKDRKDIFRLYPAGCRRLVSLLIIPPEVFLRSKGLPRFVTAKPVLELLSKIYLKNRREALMLLSHYPLWLEIFKLYLDESCRTESQSFDSQS